MCVLYYTAAGAIDLALVSSGPSGELLLLYLAREALGFQMEMGKEPVTFDDEAPRVCVAKYV